MKRKVASASGEIRSTSCAPVTLTVTIQREGARDSVGSVNTVVRAERFPRSVSAAAPDPIARPEKQ